jgi:hypothetical protein
MTQEQRRSGCDGNFVIGKRMEKYPAEDFRGEVLDRDWRSWTGLVLWNSKLNQYDFQPFQSVIYTHSNQVISHHQMIPLSDVGFDIGYQRC